MLPDEVKTKFVNSVLYWSLQRMLHMLHSTVLSCPNILIIANISDLSLLLNVLQLAIRLNMSSTLTKRTSLHFFCFPNIINTCFLMFFFTVHHIHLPTLMHNSFYSLTICMLHYNPRHVSNINMPIFRRTNCIITASGIFTLCKRLYSMPDGSRLQSW